MSGIEKKKSIFHIKVDETISKIIKQLAMFFEASRVFIFLIIY